MTSLWILPDSGFWRDIKNANDTGHAFDFWNCNGWTVKPQPTPETRLRRSVLTGWNEKGFRAKINFPLIADDVPAWAFEDLRNPYELYNALDLFRDRFAMLGQKITFPQETARAIFEGSASRKFPKLSEHPATFWKPFRQAPPKELIWIRELTKAERSKPFVHAFDKRMMFLAAARNAHFGEFEYTEVEKPKLADIPKNAAGIVEATIINGDYLLTDLYGDKGWFWLPTLRVLVEAGATVRIKRGFLWTETHRLFEKFAVRVGDAIKEFRAKDLPEFKAANAACKSAYVKFFGWLGRVCDCNYCAELSPEMNGCKISGWGSELYRPDWRGQIITTAYANLLRNVLEVRKKWGGLEPFAINHDCVMYFSDHRNPLGDFAGSPLLDENKFTHEWTLPGDVVRESIAAGGGPYTLDALGKSEGLE